MTLLELYMDALAEAGIGVPNQPPSGPSLGFIQRCFDRMITAWSERRERLFFIPEVVYPLRAGQQTYQIGPGAADFSTTAIPPATTYVRPVQVQTGYVIVGVARRIQLNILSRPAWQTNNLRSLTDPDGPVDLFYDNNRPIATFNVAAIPGANINMYLSQWNPLPNFQVGQEATVIDGLYPEAYRLALMLGLAIELAGSYQKPVKPDTYNKFQGAISIIENRNVDNTEPVLSDVRRLNIPTKGEPGILPPPPAMGPQPVQVGR